MALFSERTFILGIGDIPTSPRAIKPLASMPLRNSVFPDSSVPASILRATSRGFTETSVLQNREAAGLTWVDAEEQGPFLIHMTSFDRMAKAIRRSAFIGTL